MALPGASTKPLRSGYDVIIIGAGVQGLATAYELALRGHTDVLVIDKSWPGSGGSGRNGELIRSAFASREWCDFFELSRQRWLELSAELGHNILFARTGYVVLASTDEQLASCERDQAFQHSLGIETELVDERTMRKLLPAANPELVRGGVIQEQAGFAHHDSVVAAYLENAARLGVQIVVDRMVTEINTSGGAVSGVTLADGTKIGARMVLNAAGGAAPAINNLLGVDAGIVSARLEMIVTQPLRPFLRQAVAALELLGYCHQTHRGEFTGGTETTGVDETESLEGSWRLLQDMATKFTTLFPILRGAKLLRHWAGTVSQTPDLAPVLGPVPEVPGFVQSVGWVYGFMGAPAAGMLLADYIANGVVDERLAPFSIERVSSKNWIREGSLVVDAEY